MSILKYALIALAMIGAGCATTSSGVVPLSDGLLKLTRQGSGAWVPTSELKALGIQEATTWSETKKKQIRVVGVKEVQARPFGGWPEAEVLFKCE